MATGIQITNIKIHNKGQKGIKVWYLAIGNIIIILSYYLGINTGYRSASKGLYSERRW